MNVFRRLNGLVTLLMGLALFAGNALAYDYRVPILVDDEEDVYELLSSGDVSTDESEQLVAMLHDPLDLNDASRDDLYNLPGFAYVIVDRVIERREDKPFTRITQLGDVEGITGTILEQARPFVKVVARRKTTPGKKWKTVGRVRIQAVDRIKGEYLRDNDPTKIPWSFEDRDYPETYTLVEMKVPEKGYSAGAAVLTQNSVGTPALADVAGTYKSDRRSSSANNIDPNRYYLWSSGRTYMPSWPKAYAMIERSNWRLLTGSYRVGFGQRVVFDTTGHSVPHGFRPDLIATIGEKSFSFPAGSGMFGVVGTLSDLKTGPVTWDVTPFFSWWRHDAFNNRLVHDPGNNQTPSTYTLLTNPEEDNFGADYLSLYYFYPTLPRIYSEMIEGGNVTMRFSKRAHVGLTAYARQIDFFTDDPNTTFAYYVSQPQRDLLFVGGLDFAWGFDGAGFIDNVTIFGEGATMDNGAIAGVLRAVMEMGDFVLEPQVRYYGDDYDNPHSRMPSQDEFFEGNRDRGELGGRLSLRYQPAKWLRVRLDQDVWKPAVYEWTESTDSFEPLADPGPRLDPWRMDSYLGVDIEPVDKLRVGAYANYLDKDLSASGRGESYSNYSGNSSMTLSNGDSGSGKSLAGRGEKWKFGAHVSTRAVPHTTIKGLYNISLADVYKNEDKFGREHYGTFEIASRPLGFVSKRHAPLLAIKGRVKYFEGRMLNETLEEDDEKFVTAYVQMSSTFAKKYTVLLRGAVLENITVTKSDGTKKDKPTEYYWRVMLEWKF